jgi:replicative DNA helicase
MKPYVNRKDMQLGCFECGGNAILRNVGRTDTGKLIINDNPGISIRELISECHKLKGKHNVQTIIIDYLQLMTGSSKEDRSREEELSEISESLKKLAQELDISVVALSMLRNTVEQRVNHRPALSDFIPEYYGPLADNSDLIMFIYRDDYYHKDSCKKGKAEIIVAKNNHGRTGTVEIAWIPEYCSFCEIWRI